MTITFLADNLTYLGLNNKLHSYLDTKNAIEECKHHVRTTQLCFLSFDLLDKFDEIELVYKDVVYELKLGNNTWTSKHLRKEHNLFKIVQAYILNE
jgi:hypothetical protein